MRLDEIAAKYHCDKLTRHSYIPVYEMLLAEIDCKRLLEIGIGTERIMRRFVDKYIHGASLRMWSEYLPDAEIFACDRDARTLINEGRIRSMVADQADARSLVVMAVTFGGHFDLIVDDGSHKAAHQIDSFHALWPFVNPGGAYVIEDVREREAVAVATGGTIHRFNKTRGDCLVVIRK